MLEAACYDPGASRDAGDPPSGLWVADALQAVTKKMEIGDSHRSPASFHGSPPARGRQRYGMKMRSSSALPIAWVRFTTFSLRRIFCTWFFTVSGLILRMAPISKFDLPR
jgi:hypothetical protein